MNGPTDEQLKAWGKKRLADWRAAHKQVEITSCPVHMLVGRPCPNADGFYCTNASRWYDHVSLWRRKCDGALILVSQPYDGADVEALSSMCMTHGLTAEIDAGKSWHYPGSTTLIAIEAASDD